METCPHGARLVILQGVVVLVDDCQVCAEILADHADVKHQEPVAA